MPEPLDLAITGTGAVSPVGLSAPATCAALRAGIARIGQVHGALVEGELLAEVPAPGARVPTEWFRGGPEDLEWPGHERFGIEPPLPPHTVVPPGDDRLVELAGPAAREALAAAGLRDVPSDRFAAFVGLSADEEDVDRLTRALADAFEVPPGRVECHALGRAAALVALRAAAKALRAGEIDVALVGGVDSLIRPEALQRLREDGVLRSETRPEGVLPGEAAAFLVLERGPEASARGAARAVVLALARDHEPTAGTDDPNLAIGLTRALRKLRAAGPPLESPPHVVCDLNGDRYRASEWTFASMRAFADLHGDHGLWHPADCVGDTGAAAGALDLVWAVSALAKGYAPADRVVVWGASDGPTRAAALLAPALPE